MSTGNQPYLADEIDRLKQEIEYRKMQEEAQRRQEMSQVYGPGPNQMYGPGMSVGGGVLGPGKMWQVHQDDAIIALSKEVGHLRERLAKNERDVADFLAWLQWAHPEVREQYKKCLEVAQRVDEANGEAGVEQTQQR